MTTVFETIKKSAFYDRKRNVEGKCNKLQVLKRSVIEPLLGDNFVWISL